MIEVDIDTNIPDSVMQLLAPETMESILDNLAEMARSKWISIARKNLNSTKRDYINSIQPIEVHPNIRVITLEGWLANAVENGISGFDMHETLLNDNAKTSKEGFKYRSIPFRHATPTSQGQPGAPMGSTFGPKGAESRAVGFSVIPEHGRLDKLSSVSLGTRIYKAAKKLSQGKKGKPPERLPAGMAPRLHADVRYRPEYTHKTDIYAGMIRAGAPRHQHYMTFRTISAKVQDGSWIHPGITARHLADEVERYIEEQAPKLVMRVVKAVFEGK